MSLARYTQPPTTELIEQLKGYVDTDFGWLTSEDPVYFLTSRKDLVGAQEVEY